MIYVKSPAATNMESRPRLRKAFSCHELLGEVRREHDFEIPVKVFMGRSKSLGRLPSWQAHDEFVGLAAVVHDAHERMRLHERLDAHPEICDTIHVSVHHPELAAW